MKNKKIKILVTGGSGFIGTNLCQYLIEKDYSFINIDINPPELLSHKIYFFFK